MVIDVGAALAGDFDAVRADIAAVRAAVPDAVLKVIVESAALLTSPTSTRWSPCVAPPKMPAPTSSRPQRVSIPPAAHRRPPSR